MARRLLLLVLLAPNALAAYEDYASAPLDASIFRQEAEEAARFAAEAVDAAAVGNASGVEQGVFDLSRRASRLQAGARLPLDAQAREAGEAEARIVGALAPRVETLVDATLSERASGANLSFAASQRLLALLVSVETTALEMDATGHDVTTLLDALARLKSALLLELAAAAGEDAPPQVLIFPPEEPLPIGSRTLVQGLMVGPRPGARAVLTLGNVARAEARVEASGTIFFDLRIPFDPALLGTHALHAEIADVEDAPPSRPAQVEVARHPTRLLVRPLAPGEAPRLELQTALPAPRLPEGDALDALRAALAAAGGFAMGEGGGARPYPGAGAPLEPPQTFLFPGDAAFAPSRALWAADAPPPPARPRLVTPGTTGWILVALLVVAALLAAGLLLRMRRRAPQAPPAVPPGPATPSPDASLAEGLLPFALPSPEGRPAREVVVEAYRAVREWTVSLGKATPLATPREWAATMSRIAEGDAARELARAYERARFSPHDVPESDVRRALGAAQTLWRSLS